MFFVILAATFVVLGSFFIGHKYLRDGGMKEPSGDNFPAGGLGLFLVSLGMVFVTIGLLVSLYTYSVQVGYAVDLDKITQFEKTYQARADNLTKQFASYLAGVYPQHEKEIFSRIEPGKLDIYLVKYPELQASKTIMVLVDQERSLQDDIYKQQITRAETIRNMRYNVRSPWVYQWIMPDIAIPEN